MIEPERRYDAWIWLDGLVDFSKPSKIVSVYSAGDGMDVLRSLQEEYGSKAIISLRNEEDENKIRE